MEMMVNDIHNMAEVFSLWMCRNGPARGAQSLEVEFIVWTGRMLWIDYRGMEEDVDEKEC
jgi:hypothetical protein